jgi:hypothetical protein
MLRFLTDVEYKYLKLPPIPTWNRRLIVTSEFCYYITSQGRIRGRGLNIHPVVLGLRNIVQLVYHSNTLLVLTLVGYLYNASTSEIIAENTYEVQASTSSLMITVSYDKHATIYRSMIRDDRSKTMIDSAGFSSPYIGSVAKNGREALMYKSKTHKTTKIGEGYNRCTCDTQFFYFYRFDGSITIVLMSDLSCTNLRLSTPITDIQFWKGYHIALLADGRLHLTRTDSERSWRGRRVLSLCVSGDKCSILLDTDEIRELS